MRDFVRRKKQNGPRHRPSFRRASWFVRTRNKHEGKDKCGADRTSHPPEGHQLGKDCVTCQRLGNAYTADIQVGCHTFRRVAPFSIATRPQFNLPKSTTPDGNSWRIAERTLRNWLNRYRKGRLDKLENRRNKTHGQMRALDESVLAAAKGLRERMRTRSIQDILMHLKFTSGIDVSKISTSTLNRHLNRWIR